MATPEQVAAEHQAQRAALAALAREAAARQWAAVNPNDVARSWLAHVPTTTAVVSAAQLQAARAADPYLAAMAAAQGLDPASAAVVASAFAGVASDGRQLASLLVQPVFAVLTALAGGSSPERALAAGQASLEMIVGTQVADAGRSADQAALVANKQMTGYTRVLNPPSCARCVLLAGQFYEWNDGFLRHPLCDCTHAPGKRETVGDLTDDPMAYFDSLSEGEQDRTFTKAGAEAIRDGADIYQVVNARRGMATVDVGGHRVKVTTEGITTRALFGGFEIDPDTGKLRRRRDDELKRSGRRTRVARKPRLLPEEIYRIAGGDRDEAIRLLRANGYLRGAPTARPTGAPAVNLVSDPTPELVAQDKLFDAYHRLAAGHDEWVMIADLRDAHPELSREEFDAALRNMMRAQRDGIRVIPTADRARLTERERAAAVIIGGEENHMVSIRPGTGRPSLR